MSAQERIALIGYRGSGKSTIAKVLAERLGWTSLDADVVLERRAGCTIREIFAREGEAGFREREAALLNELCATPRLVLATGGGVIVREDNRALLMRSSWVVWLDADADTLYQRLEHDATSAHRRPALNVGDAPVLTAANSLTEIRAILQFREPLYRQCAAVRVAAASHNAASLAAEIERLWRNNNMAAQHSPRFLQLVNEVKTRIRETTVPDVQAMLARGERFLLIDVREESEWAKDHLPNAIHLGKGILERDVEERIPDAATPLVLYCGGGFRSALAADNLQKMGYTNVLSMDGGIRGWREQGYPLTKG